MYDSPMRPFKHLPLSEFVLERLFYALSDPVRLEIVRRLAELGEAS
ncbi:transcriptional regulator, partial [Pseudomonas sp. MWU12-2312b]